MDQNQDKSSAARVRPIVRIAKTLFCVLFLLATILVGLGLFVRLALDGSALAGLVLPRIESAIGRKISYSSVRLNWLSTATGRISLTDVKIGGTANSPPVIYIPSLAFEIDFSTVTKGSVKIRSARFIRPVLTLRAEYAPVGRDRTEGSRISTFILNRLHVARVEVTDARVVSATSRSDSGQDRLVLSKVGILAKEVTADGVRNCVVQGEINAGNRTGLFDFSGNLESTPFSGKAWKGSCTMRLVGCPLSSIQVFGSHLGYKIPFSDGTAEVELNFAGSTESFKAKGEVKISRASLIWDKVYSGTISLAHASAQFAVDRSGDRIQLEITQARLPGLSISGEARLGSISHKDATLTVAVRNADIDLQQIFPFIPLKLLKQEERNRFVRAGLKGHVRITGAAWTGKRSWLAQGRGLKGIVGVEAILDRVSGFVPVLGLPVENATGTVHLNSDKLLFNSISLTLGSSPILLNGTISNLKAQPKANLFISMKAHAQDLYPVLTSKAFAGSLKPWLTPIINPKGGVAVTLDLKGNLYRPRMKGRLELKDFTCGVEGFPLAVKSVNGSIKFRRTGIAVSQIEGVIGTSRAVLKGSASSGDVDLNCDVKLTPTDFKKLLKPPEGWTISRKIPISLVLEGSTSEVDFSATMDLKRNGLNFGSYIRKKVGSPLRIEASGTGSSDGIMVEEAYLILAENRIAGSAKIGRDGKALISINLPPKGIPTKELIPLIHPSLQFKPGGRVEGDATIRIGSSLKPVIDANLKLTHVSLHLPGFHKRTSGMVATIRQNGNTFHLDIEHAKHGSSLLSGTVTIIGLDRPQVDVGLVFSFLDTTDFTAPAGYVSDVTWGEWIRSNSAMRLLARGSTKVSIKALKGKTSQRVFSHFRTDIEGKGGLLKSGNWKLNISDGIIQGTALFDIRKSTQIPFALDFQGDQLRMEKVMLSDSDWLRVEGDVVVQGQVQWNLSSNRANHGMYKTANIEFRVHDGIINRFDILSKLFSLINLGSILRGRLPDMVQQGLPFQSLTWDMEVHGNKWKFKDMKLIADAARINAFGMYFTDQDRVDFQVDVSPLVGFDKIFSGLFGNLVTKNGKLLTTTFKIRGLYKSPDVRLIP